MNHHKEQDFSFKKKKQLKGKSDRKPEPGKWLKAIYWNRFAYLALTVFIFAFVVTFPNPSWLPIGQSVAYGSLAEGISGQIMLAQEESEEPAREEKAESEEPTREEKAEPKESAEEKAESEEPAREEKAESEEPAREEKAESEEPAREEKAESEESAREEKAESEEGFSFEETKKFLEEEIDERYEEWETQKRNSEISHGASAIATIIMTIFITLLGSGLLDIPYKKLVVFLVGIAAVLIQLNVNVFLLEKSLQGYEILAQQGSALKEKLEFARTTEDVKEIREQFQELVIQSLEME